MRTSSGEDQYTTIFLVLRVAVWTERLYRSDFFEKSLEIRDSNLSQIDQNWAELDLRQGKLGSDIAKLIGKGLGTS